MPHMPSSGKKMPETELLPLLSHLQACPPDFFRPKPWAYTQWSVLIPALLHDFLAVPAPQSEVHNQRIPPELLSRPEQAEWLPPLCWLLSHPSLQAAIQSEQALSLLLNLSQRLGAAFPVREILLQPQRAEECIRELLSALNWQIQTETAAESATQLAYLSSTDKQQRHQLSQKKRQRAAAVLQAQQRLQAMDNAD